MISFSLMMKFSTQLKMSLDKSLKPTKASKTSRQVNGTI